MRIWNAFKRYLTLTLLAVFVAPSGVTATALDDIRIEISHDDCDAASSIGNNFIVYATNLNLTQAIDANFKYDSSPAQQHFILFDANLTAITDRFPKLHARRLGPGETARIGCTSTYRAAPAPPGPLSVPLIITKQAAAYVDANAAEAPPEVARTFATFLLQGGISECAAGAKPPGLFYLVNLHPYARLSTSMNLLDDRGARVGVLSPTLSPLSATRVACSNGFSKPGPINSATLEAAVGMHVALPAAPPRAKPPQLPEPQESPPIAALPPVALPLGAILYIQNVCAGSAISGWIKINDTWNPTVCGNPATLTYNVWTLQQLSDQPVGAIIHACKGPIPSAWTLVGAAWNPTVCGHPAGNQSNVMVIKRLE